MCLSRCKIKLVIPISLQLNNFLSYAGGQEPLDFTRFDTACLCGNNGNGKSALLDGLTWAMWGKARHETPNLLRLGGQEMRVELVFDLDGERYRITRGWAKKKTGGTPSLELNILDAPSGLYRPITRPSVRETQEQLSALLRMDYETFIASAYLKQGQADRFSRQPPGERKKVLAEILGLSRYQEIADQAREELRATERRVVALEAQLDGIEAFLSGREDAQSLFDYWTQQLETLAPRIEREETRLHDARARKNNLLNDRERAQNLTGEIQKLERELPLLKQQRGARLSEKAEIDEWQAQQNDIVNDFQAHGEARQTVEKWRAVRDRWRELKDEADALKEHIREADAALKQRLDALDYQIAQARETLAEGESQMARGGEIRAGFDELREAQKREHEYSCRRADWDEAKQILENAREALRMEGAQLESRAHSLSAQIEENKRVVAREAEVRAQVEAARVQASKLEEANAQIAELQIERNELDARRTQIRHALDEQERGLEASRQKLTVLQANPQAQCPLCDSQLGERERERIQENIEDEMIHAQNRIDELMAEARLLKGKIAALDAPIAQSQKRLSEAPRIHRNEAVAEEQWKTIESAREKLKIQEAEHAQLAAQLAQGTFAVEESARVTQAETALGNIGYDSQQHAQANRAVQALRLWEKEMLALEAIEKQVATARRRLSEAEPQREETRAKIEAGDAAPEQTVALERLKAQAARLQYDREARAAHQSAEDELKRLEAAPQRWTQLQSKLKRLPDVEADLEENARALASREESLQQLREESDKLRDVAVKIAACERDLQEASEELARARAAQNEATAERGKQENTLELCAQEEIKREALDEERKTWAREAIVLKHTSTAFGKEGIQALIIENAIPEIQDDANEILRRLTRNHMQISMESTREKQSGGSRETLDIKISDDRGTREYALFSGGEAFRADFALRIALSKLLARRAGTQLRTLIIDEGFGTQDAEGLQQMIECIQAISSDFDKVLVVTHLETIKNAFQTRIEVTKEPDTGSRYAIVG